MCSHLRSEDEKKHERAFSVFLGMLGAEYGEKPYSSSAFSSQNRQLDSGGRGTKLAYHITYTLKKQEQEVGLQNFKICDVIPLARLCLL